MDKKMKLERCWICDEFTGNTGRGDDSLYDDEGGGAYCSECWKQMKTEGVDKGEQMDYKEKMLTELVDVLIRVDVSDFMRHKVIRMMGKILASLPSEEEIAKGWWDKYIYDVEHRGYAYDFGTWLRESKD